MFTISKEHFSWFLCSPYLAWMWSRQTKKCRRSFTSEQHRAPSYTYVNSLETPVLITFINIHWSMNENGDPGDLDKVVFPFLKSTLRSLASRPNHHHHPGLLGSLCSMNCVLNRTMSQLGPWRKCTVWTPSDHSHTRLKSDTRPSRRWRKDTQIAQLTAWAVASWESEQNLNFTLEKTWRHCPPNPWIIQTTLHSFAWESQVLASLIWWGRLQTKVKGRWHLTVTVQGTTSLPKCLVFPK